jgi:adenylate kinase family enzyme
MTEPAPDRPRRVAVIGTSGSGKTTFSSQLAARLGVPHIELDALSWEADWVATPGPVLRDRVTAAVAGETWVIDGNYSATRDLVWGRADTVIWLDLPLRVVMWRVVNRTVRRVARGDLLWSGNRERMGMALSRDSIILWALTTYHRRRRDYPRLLAQRPELHVVRLRSAGQVAGFLTATGFRDQGPTSEPRSRLETRPAGSSPEAETRQAAPDRQ